VGPQDVDRQRVVTEKGVDLDAGSGGGAGLAPFTPATTAWRWPAGPGDEAVLDGAVGRGFLGAASQLGLRASEQVSDGRAWLRLLRWCGAVLAGLLLLAAFPPVGWWWSAPVGVAALLGAVRGTGYRRSWALTAAAHLVLFLPLLEWVRFLGVGPWVALGVLEAAVAGLLGPLVVAVDRVSRDRGAVQAAGLVGAFVLVEGLRARAPFNGLTWGRLGFGQSEGPLLPLAAVGGAPLVGAAVALVGVCLLAVVSAPAYRRTLTPAGVVAAAVAFALAVPTPVDGPAVEVAVVQGNVPRSGVGAFAEDLLVLDNHLRETERLAAQVRAGTRPQPDLVIWPENASDQDPRTEPESRARVDAAVEALGQPLLLGAVLRDGPTGLSNGIVVYGEGGVQGEPYRKQHLVPFGEYLPLRALVERIYPPAATLLARDFSPGELVGRLDLNGVPLAVGTCFEVAFDDLPREAVRAGGELLVLPSNNASYGRSAQSAQQLAMARLRAVEHGRSTVVSTTSGISALVRPDGEVVARSALFQPAVLQAELPRRTDLTLATRFGGPVEAALGLLVLMPVMIRRRRVHADRGR
jgi:apolipoprotein N-acyltransferase